MRKILILCLILLGGVARADRAEDLGQLVKALDIDGLTQVMQEEGKVFAADIAAQMLGGDGDSRWRDAVIRIYDHPTMVKLVSAALDAGVTDAQLAALLRFYQSDLGQRVVAQEVATRRAMLDLAVEENARAEYIDLEGSDDPRLALIAEFVRINDLIETNVAGGLSSNYQFYRGLIDGGGFDADEKDILADVWSQEEEIRTDTREWVFGFSLMAYQPLSDADLRAYVDMSATEAGRALNQALFDGFDRMYAEIAYALGLAASASMSGQDL